MAPLRPYGDVATATRYRDLLVTSLQRAAADARRAAS